MSFASKVKSELTHIEIHSDCCAKAELTAIANICGDVCILGAGRYSLSITMDTAESARRVYQLVKRLYDAKSQISISERRRLNKGSDYIIAFDESPETARMLSETGILRSIDGSLTLGYGMDETLLHRNCCTAAFLRGVFLAAGTVSDPKRSYHLEFALNNEKLAEDIWALLNSHELNARMGKRKDTSLVYIKESDRIAELLTIIGAHTSVLDMESVRVYKDVRNNVNRRVNCETANIDRTSTAAARQIEDIEYIIKNHGIKKLPEQLRTVAEARINNQDASLNQLAELFDGQIGRSGINYRLKKIEELAAEMRSSNVKGEST